MSKHSALRHSAKDFFPEKHTLSAFRQAAQTCRGCHLYRHATQTVFGEGPSKAELIVVGEIAGEKEDVLGRPFVGPAGTFLRESMADVGLDEKQIYFTNVVKHFKFVAYHNKRLHRTPVGSEIKACKPWLDAEIELIQPKAILCLGAIAAKTLIDPQIKIRLHHGKWSNLSAQTKVIMTFHPSAILRAPDREARHEMKKLFLRDIKKIAVFLSQD